MDLGLHGKTALITGSYRGTGRAIARVLAAEGATVVVHGFDAAPAEAVATDIRANGGDARAVVGNLLSDEGAAALAADTGPVDILVANYGVADGGSWFGEATDEDAWFESYNKNVLSAVRLVRRCAPTMVERGWGRVILVGTVGSLRPGTRNPQYYAAKGALPALTVSLAKELAPNGVTVNLVSPGILANRRGQGAVHRAGRPPGQTHRLGLGAGTDVRRVHGHPHWPGPRTGRGRPPRRLPRLEQSGEHHRRQLPPGRRRRRRSHALSGPNRLR